MAFSSSFDMEHCSIKIRWDHQSPHGLQPTDSSLSTSVVVLNISNTQSSHHMRRLVHSLLSCMIRASIKHIYRGLPFIFFVIASMITKLAMLWRWIVVKINVFSRGKHEHVEHHQGCFFPHSPSSTVLAFHEDTTVNMVSIVVVEKLEVVHAWTKD
jgi:hypothetical protein